MFYYILYIAVTDDIAETIDREPPYARLSIDDVATRRRPLEGNEFKSGRKAMVYMCIGER